MRKKCSQISKTEINKILSLMTEQYKKNHVAVLSRSEQDFLNKFCDNFDKMCKKLGYKFDKEGFSHIVCRLYPKGEMFGGDSPSSSSKKMNLVPYTNTNRRRSNKNKTVRLNAAYFVSSDFVNLVAIICSILLFYMAYIEYTRATAKMKEHELFHFIKAIAEAFETSVRVGNNIEYSVTGLTWLRILAKYFDGVKCIVNAVSAPYELVATVVLTSIKSLIKDAEKNCIVRLNSIDTTNVTPTFLPLVNMLNNAIDAVYNLASDKTGLVFFTCSAHTGTQKLSKTVLEINDLTFSIANSASRINGFISLGLLTYAVPALTYFNARIKQYKRAQRINRKSTKRVMMIKNN